MARSWVLAAVRFVIALALGTVLLLPVGVWASPTPQAVPGRSLAVGVPAQPVNVTPGTTADLPLRVLDPGTKAVTVRVIGEGIELGNNGKVTLTSRPDPQWAPYTSYPVGTYTIPAEGYIDLTITLHVPAHVAPNLYFIGFLVTPIVTGTGVVQVNQIGDFITINVPGPRNIRLTATLDAPDGGFHIGNIVIGTAVHGTLAVHNVGQTSEDFWGDDEITTHFQSTPVEDRMSVSLIPSGTERTTATVAQPAFPVDVVTQNVSVFYPGALPTSSKQIVITRGYLVINPWVLIVLAAILVTFVAWKARSRRGQVA